MCQTITPHSTRTNNARKMEHRSRELKRARAVLRRRYEAYRALDEKQQHEYFTGLLSTNTLAVRNDAALCGDLRLTHAARRAMLSCSPGPRSLRRTTLGRARFHIVSGQRSQTTDRDRATGVERRISHPPPFAPPLAWRIRARGVILTPRVRVGDHKHALCGGDAPF